MHHLIELNNTNSKQRSILSFFNITFSREAINHDLDPFTRYRYETLPVKNHYVFNHSHGTGRVILVTTFVHFIMEIRTLKCFA